MEYFYTWLSHAHQNARAQTDECHYLCHLFLATVIENALEKEGRKTDDKRAPSGRVGNERRAASGMGKYNVCTFAFASYAARTQVCVCASANKRGQATNRFSEVYEVSGADAEVTRGHTAIHQHQQQHIYCRAKLNATHQAIEHKRRNNETDSRTSARERASTR